MLIVRWQWGTPPLLLDQDEFHSETTIYLSIHKTHNKNGWFLGHDDPPRLAPADDDEDAVWWCLQCHSRKCPHFFSRGWWCRHNDWWRVSRTLEGAIITTSPAWPAAEEPTRIRWTEIFFFSPDVDHISEFIIIIIIIVPPMPLPPHHHRPPVARPNITTILNFFSILFRCDMTKIGWMRRLIDCLLTWEEHNFKKKWQPN